MPNTMRSSGAAAALPAAPAKRKGGCLNREDIAAFRKTGQLSDDGWQHLDRCGECLRTLEKVKPESVSAIDRMVESLAAEMTAVGRILKREEF